MDANVNLSTYLDFTTMIEPIPIRALRPAKNNPRSTIGDLDELTQSIRANGLIEPIIVRPLSESNFEVVVGTRRFLAMKALRWTHVPCIIKSLSDKESFEIALAENISRRTLSVMEEARAFQRYVYSNGWGSMSDLAQQIGKSESYVSHRLKLLTLPAEVQCMIECGDLAPSTAKQIAWLENPELQTKLARKVIEDNLSTHKLRQIVKSLPANSIIDSNSAIPDFEPAKLSTRREKPKLILDNAALALRMALVRLDLLVEKCAEEESALRSFLLQTRKEIHALIDKCISERTALREAKRKVSIIERSI